MQFFYDTVDIQRMASTGEGISKTMQALYTGVSCQVMPLDNQSAVANGWDFGQGYQVFFDTTQDVKKGDKLIWGNLTLIVQGIKDFANMPLLSHKEVICTTEES